MAHRGCYFHVLRQTRPSAEEHRHRDDAVAHEIRLRQTAEVIGRDDAVLID